MVLGLMMEALGTSAAVTAESFGPSRSRSLPRLLLIDPMPLTRNCLVAGLSDTAVASVVATPDIDAAVGLADRGEDFDAAVLNLGGDPIDDDILATYSRLVRGAYPDILLLLLTCHTELAGISAALRQGIRAYLTTDRSLEMTLDAIRLTCAGWTIYPAFGLGVLTSMAQASARIAGPAPGSDNRSALTPRQRDVFDLLATGMPNKRIAAELRMSESTVKAHIKGIMQRVGAHNRTEIVARLRGAGDWTAFAT